MIFPETKEENNANFKSRRRTLRRVRLGRSEFVIRRGSESMIQGGISPEAEQAEDDEVGEEEWCEGWSAVDEVCEGVDGGAS